MNGRMPAVADELRRSLSSGEAVSGLDVGKQAVETRTSAGTRAERRTARGCRRLPSFGKGAARVFVRPSTWYRRVVVQAKHRFIPHRPPRLSHEETLERAKAFHELMNGRRSVRQFSPDPVPREAIEWAIRTASTAPSGAHRQPWRFVVVDDASIKREIRLAAEEEERRSYEGGRMPPEWLEALAPLGTDWRKPYLELVPYIVVVFEELTGFGPDGSPRKNYYVKESCGLACGLFVAALHNMGLATLTHTPSPMAFLNRILGRPKNEKPYILFPIGYPAPDAEVPDLERKPLDAIALWNPRPEGEA
jgi:iodotyrosine deiodinase